MSSVTPRGPIGRPRDSSRDEALLKATAQLLTEHGYAGFTVGEVAALAHASKATVYRRWSTKAELVVAALAHALDAELTLPDTGSLRGDLMLLVDHTCAAVADTEQLMHGVIGHLGHDHELAAAFRRGFVEHRRDMGLQVFERGRARGDVAPHADIDMLVDLVPAVVFYRVLVLGQLPSVGTAGAIVDQVILPLASPPVGDGGGVERRLSSPGPGESD